MMVVTNLGGVFTRSTFRGQIEELVSTMQMAARAASQGERRYEVIIDLVEQSYMLREISGNDLLSDVLEEQIIVDNELKENCQIVYVLLDDLSGTDPEHQGAKFRVGRSGWQNGGKIVLVDEKEKLYSVIVNRVNGIVELRQGDVDLLMPRSKDELPF